MHSTLLELIRDYLLATESNTMRKNLLNGRAHVLIQFWNFKAQWKSTIMFCRLFYIFFLSFLFFFYRVLSPYFILSYFYLKFKPRVFKQLWVAFRIFMWCEMYIIYVNVYIWKGFFLSSKKKNSNSNENCIHTSFSWVSVIVRRHDGGFFIWCIAFNTILVVCVLNHFVTYFYFSRDLYKNAHLFFLLNNRFVFFFCYSARHCIIDLVVKGYWTDLLSLIRNDIINIEIFYFNYKFLWYLCSW